LLLTNDDWDKINIMIHTIFPDYSPMLNISGATEYENRVELKLVNTDLCIICQKIYVNICFDPPSHETKKSDWKLYINGVIINRTDDGPWWDAIREEIPKIEIKIYEYSIQMYDLKNKIKETTDAKRKKELQRAKNYLNGWRWWKFWWKENKFRSD